jgi:hypothetical protein
MQIAAFMNTQADFLRADFDPRISEILSLKRLSLYRTLQRFSVILSLMRLNRQLYSSMASRNQRKHQKLQR